MSTHPADTSFAPWSLMTPDLARARRGEPEPGDRAAVRHVEPNEDRHSPKPREDDGYMFGEDGFSFSDFLDIVNPLQHLPVIGTIYREITGDEIDPGASIAGGALFGGPIGLAGAVINRAIEAHSGNDIAGHVMTAFAGGGSAEDTGTAVASGSAGPEPGDGFAGRQLPPQIASGAEIDITPMQIPTGARPFAATPAGNAGPDRAAGAPESATTMPAARYDMSATNRIEAASGFASPATGRARSPAGQPSADRPRTDYGGLTRISPEMAEHLAMLAQRTGPAEAPVPPVPAQSPAESGPLPQPFDPVHAATGNPFTDSEEPVRADGPDGRTGRSATLADPVAPPSPGTAGPDRIREAMFQALQRYEAMQRNQG